MTDVDLLLKEIKTLPLNRIAEVLDFVEFLKQKDSRIAESIRKPAINPPETSITIEDENTISDEEILSDRHNSLEDMLVDLDA